MIIGPQQNPPGCGKRAARAQPRGHVAKGAQLPGVHRMIRLVGTGEMADDQPGRGD